MKIKVGRIQRGVGQGGFHTASVNVLSEEYFFGKKSTFDYVYDCGTSSQGPSKTKKMDFLNKHICDYQPTDGIVDALFISHLDSDHYNGAEKLCQEKTVSRVFLPYFTVDEILLLLLNKEIATTVAFINAMLSIASGTLTIFGRPVTIVGGKPPSKPDGDPPVRPEPTKLDDRLLPVLLDAQGKIFPLNDHIPTGSSIGLFFGKQVVPWVLRPWSYKQNDAAEKDMARIVDGIPQLKDLKSRAPNITAADLREIEKNKQTLRDAAEKIIKKAGASAAADYKDRNAPSICLYSGPRCRMTNRYQTAYEDRGSTEPVLQSNQIGWLATGDALLNRHYSDFKKVFQDVFGLVGTFVLPHHGASANHSPEFIGIMGGGLAVICARHGNTHHPSTDVLDALYENNVVSKIVDEYLVYGLSERVILKTQDC